MKRFKFTLISLIIIVLVLPLLAGIAARKNQLEIIGRVESVEDEIWPVILAGTV